MDDFEPLKIERHHPTILVQLKKFILKRFNQLLVNEFPAYVGASKDANIKAALNISIKTIKTSAEFEVNNITSELTKLLVIKINIFNITSNMNPLPKDQILEIAARFFEQLTVDFGNAGIIQVYHLGAPVKSIDEVARSYVEKILRVDYSVEFSRTGSISCRAVSKDL